MKSCRICGEIKLDNDFYPGDSRCKSCACKSVRENRKNKKEYYVEYDRKRAMRPDRVKARERYQKTAKGKESVERAKKKWQKNNIVKRAAHILLWNALRDGKIIKPICCSECGKGNVRIHGHHDDYAFPLSVKWLCPKCHNELHAAMRGAAHTETGVCVKG